jgi:VCBS repeat-containing protein
MSSASHDDRDNRDQTKIGTNKDDVLNGSNRRDVLYGLQGNDTLYGLDGSDRLYGGDGNDMLDGGSGSDCLDGGAGNDVAIYRLAENNGAHDRYDGGSGTDTLRLELTRNEWLNSSVQSDIARFLSFLERNDWRCGADTFDFRAFGLEVRNFEAVKIIVDGVELSAQDDRVDARDDAFSIAATAKLSGQVLANDSVPDLVRAVSLVKGPAKGVLVLNADGTFSYDSKGAFSSLPAGQTATVTFTYKVVDADGDSDTATATITITGGAGGNSAPVVTAAITSGTVTERADHAVDENTAVHTAGGTIAFTDANLGDSHTVSVTPAATGFLGTLTATVTNAATGDGAGVVTWSYQVSDGTLDHLKQGETLSQSYTVAISDGHGGVVIRQVAVTLTGANDGPVAHADAFVVNEEQAVPATAKGVPIDGLTDLQFYLSGGAAVTLGDLGTNMVLVSVCAAWCRPCEAFAHDSGPIQSDLASLGVITIEWLLDDLNLIPGVAAGASEAQRWASRSSAPVWHTGGDVAMANAVIPFIEGLPGAGGSFAFPTYLLLDLSQGVVVDAFVGYTNKSVFVDRIEAALNDYGFQPSAVPLETLNVFADNGAGADSDADGDALTVIAVDGAAAGVGAVVTLASGATVKLDANGDLLFHPAPSAKALAEGESTTETITYTISDGHGGASTSAVTVTVQGDNDPVIARNDAFEVNQDATGIVGSVLGNDSDPDATNTLRVVAIQRDGLPTSVNGATTIALNDGGSLTINAEGEFSFDQQDQFRFLAAGETTTVVAHYLVADVNSDGTLAGTRDDADIKIEIIGSNDQVDAVDDGFFADDSGFALEITNAAFGLLRNDTDIDSSDGRVVTSTGTFTTSLGGSVTILANGTFSYVASEAAYASVPLGEMREDTFTYAIKDVFSFDGSDAGSTDSAIATIFLFGVNDAPKAAPDVNEGAPIVKAKFGDHGNTVATGNVLANDTDVDGDAISVTGVAVGTDPGPISSGDFQFGTYGSLVVQTDGSWNYFLDNSDPDTMALAEDETAEEVFSYTIRDPSGETSTSTLTIEIKGAIDDPAGFQLLV